MQAFSSQVSNISCDTCRIKKLKCSREYPSCQACIQKCKPCHYSGRPQRSPLTRSHLSSVERRLQQMENLFAELHPEINIDEALASASGSKAGQPHSHNFEVLGGISHSKRLGSESFKPSDQAISERVPEKPDGFDWHENVANLADGMANLSVDPNGTGYLGSTAGVFFLRSLLNWKEELKGIVTESEVQDDTPLAINQLQASSQMFNLANSRQVISSLMDSYFSVYHRTYPFVHEGTFRAQFQEVIPRPHQRSYQMLLHTVLALGAWCLNKEDSELDEELYHHALSFVEADNLFESANLTFVQALVLLSNLSQKRNKPNTGSNFLGLAIRMALSLGLHRELPNWNINPLQREMRRRVWWGLYIFDSGASTTFGRPILLPGQESMDVRSVLNIQDECLTATTEILPEESMLPTLYSGLKCQSDLHVHSNHISNMLLSSSSISPEDALSMNQSLDTWSQTLPPYFLHDYQLPIADGDILFAKSRLWWRFWNLKIILFRQFLLKRAVDKAKPTLPPASDSDAKCRDEAVGSASATIASIQSYATNSDVSRLASWYSIFFLFHASLVIALAVVGNADSASVPTWQVDLDTVRHILLVTFANNPLASRCVDVLNLIVPPTDSDSQDNTDLDFAWIDFSTWPADVGDYDDYLRWPESGGML